MNVRMTDFGIGDSVQGHGRRCVAERMLRLEQHHLRRILGERLERIGGVVVAEVSVNESRALKANVRP